MSQSSPETVSLLPCPFCGSPFVTMDRCSHGRPAARCDDCGALGPCTNLLDGAAATAWNARFVSPQEKADRD